MITGSQKPIKEIIGLVEPYQKILILGCGTCVKTCFAGGEDEVAVLASALRLGFKKMARSIRIEEMTIERQCENEFIQEAAAGVERNEPIFVKHVIQRIADLREITFDEVASATAPNAKKLFRI